MRRALIAVWLLAAGGAALAQQGSSQTSTPVNAHPTTTQPVDDPNGPRVTRLTVYPAAPPEPALKYRLLPVYGDLTDGNGALLYYQALGIVERAAADDPNLLKPVGDWVGLPADGLPLSELRKVLANDDVRSALRYAGYASRCAYCEWSFTLGRPGEGISGRLPNLSTVRTLGRLLALQAIVAVGDGDIDGAVHALTTAYALARDIGSAPVVVCGLMGVSCAAVCKSALEELMQSPRGLNLYWALATLPQPLIDMHRAWEGESSTLESTVPLVAERRRRALTPAEWNKLLTDLTYTGREQSDADERAVAAMTAVLSFPAGRDYLTSHGYSEEQVAAMLPAQVIVTYWCDEYHHWLDEELKWYGLPYWQALPGMVRLNGEFDEAMKSVGAVSRALLPALERAAFLGKRLERDVSLLCAIEALRAYVAVHNKLPNTLVEVTEWPIPLDPLYGKPFAYRIAPVWTDYVPYELPIGSVILESLAPPRHEPRDGVRYEVTFLRSPPTQGR